MNTFFMIVTFVIVSAQQIDRPLYVFSDPVFKNYGQCFEYVQKNYMGIYTKAASNYNFKHRPEAIFCVNERAVKEIFNYNAPTIEKKSI